eukprot:11004056-Alexandrium_andersonii.AAC.1
MVVLPVRRCWTGSAGAGWAQSLPQSRPGPSIRTPGRLARIAPEFGGPIYRNPTMEPNSQSWTGPRLWARVHHLHLLPPE